MSYKQAIVVRKDILMGKGKLAVQVAHASVTCVLNALRRKEVHEKWVWSWFFSDQKKIVLKVYSESELKSIYEMALEKNLPASCIKDAGRTQIAPGTLTTVCIGPAPEEMVDEVTGDLPLY